MLSLLITHPFSLQVLEELERRRVQEDTARWDFAALDKTGNGRITVTDALLLFKMTHGDGFSLRTCNEFLASRTDPVNDLCFDDVRLLLCALPSDDAACSAKDLEEEEKRLEKKKEEKMREECETLQKRHVSLLVPLHLIPICVWGRCLTMFATV